MTMKKKQIKFRTVRQSDLQIIRDWRNSSGTREFNTQFTLLNMVNQKQWFDAISQRDSTRKMFMILDGANQPIGICGLINMDNENRSADIAIIIGERKRRGKMLGYESLNFLVKYGFKKLKLHRIGAEIFEYNVSSIGLFEKVGFELEAIFRESLWRMGKWWNVYLYSILTTKYRPVT